jgi:uncharacterized lipoprotein YmbA
MMRVFHAAAMIFMAAQLLSGCGSLLVSPEPPQRTYWLEATPVAAPVTANLSISLISALDSNRIWVLQRDGRLNYYAGAAWPDRLGRLLPDVIMRALPQAIGTQSVSMDVVIERFFAVEGPSDVPASVELQALIRGPAGSSCRLLLDTRPATGRLRDIAAAHQQVLDQLVAELRDLAAIAAKEQPLDC